MPRIPTVGEKWEWKITIARDAGRGGWVWRTSRVVDGRVIVKNDNQVCCLTKGGARRQAQRAIKRFIYDERPDEAKSEMFRVHYDETGRRRH